MDGCRIKLTSWTASFRYPNLISGYQPSLPVPPLSTIYGLISSAMGEYFTAYDAPVGFVFSFEMQTIDIESIYQVGGKSSPLVTKSNIIRRQFLVNNTLWLYVTDSRISESFLNPHFQLLLGRSSDLATVHSVERIKLEPVLELNKLRGTVVPMGTTPLSAPIQALPISFTNETPRRNMGVFPFYLLEYDHCQSEALPISGFFDSELNHQIYWHDYTGSS